MVRESNPGVGEIFASVRSGPGAHPASCIMGIWSLFRGLSGRIVVLTTVPPLRAEAKERVEV